MDPSDFQTVGFHFAVSFKSKEFKSNIDARFQSVSGLDVQMETETIKEGGENRFEHVVPVRRKFSDLILKRGLLSPGSTSEMTNWLMGTFQEFGSQKAKAAKATILKEGRRSLNALGLILPVNITIFLLDQDHKPLMKWEILHAWPKSWKFGELNAERGEILIETLELNYNRFEFKGVQAKKAKVAQTNTS